jgi:hypothetical protein
VNKKLYHLLKIIMYTWWVIMFSKGIFFWWSCSVSEESWENKTREDVSFLPNTKIDDFSTPEWKKEIHPKKCQS